MPSTLPTFPHYIQPASLFFIPLSLSVSKKLDLLTEPIFQSPSVREAPDSLTEQSFQGSSVSKKVLRQISC